MLCRTLEMPTNYDFVANFGYGGWQTFQQLTCFVREQVDAPTALDYYITSPHTPQLKYVQCLRTFNWKRQHLVFSECGHVVDPTVLRDAVQSLEDLLKTFQELPDLERRIAYPRLVATRICV